MARRMITFPNEYEGLYNLALVEPVKFELENEELAIYTQHQLHAFRRSAEEEAPSLARDWRDVVVRRKESTILMENKHASLRQAIAHLDLGSAKTHEPGEDELEAYLKSLGENDESGSTE